jgi:hypothetical protein
MSEAAIAVFRMIRRAGHVVDSSFMRIRQQIHGKEDNQFVQEVEMVAAQKKRILNIALLP